jgi:hypothetical protein
MGIVILTCLMIVGVIGGRRNLASGLELEILPQNVLEESPQDCEFL